MSLAERLRKKAVLVESITVDGDKYLVTGKSKRERSALMAKCRSKKTGITDFDRLEVMLLESCVSDEEGNKASASEWDAAPAHITGPLIDKIRRVCGMDREDLEESDPKDLDSTES